MVQPGMPIHVRFIRFYDLGFSGPGYAKNRVDSEKITIFLVGFEGYFIFARNIVQFLRR